MFRLLIVDIVDVGAVGQKEQLGQVVEDNSNTVVVEGVAKTVLVAVVDPLAHPGHGLRLGILTLILSESTSLLPRLACYQLAKLFVKFGEVAVTGSSCTILVAVFPLQGRRATSKLRVHLREWGAAGYQGGVHLRVEPEEAYVRKPREEKN